MGAGHQQGFLPGGSKVVQRLGHGTGDPLPSIQGSRRHSRLPGVFSSLATAGRGRVDQVLIGVGQRERSSVGGHPDHQFLLGRAQLGPHLSGEADRQLLPPLRVRTGRIQGRVVARLLLPLAVEVVGHQVDKVQPLGHSRNVVTSSHVVRTHRNRGGQKQPIILGSRTRRPLAAP